MEHIFELSNLMVNNRFVDCKIQMFLTLLNVAPEFVLNLATVGQNQ